MDMWLNYNKEYFGYQCSKRLKILVYDDDEDDDCTHTQNFEDAQMPSWDGFIGKFSMKIVFVFLLRIIRM